jgi:RNA polymerase sigma-70 factor (ECF subfamily)
MGPDLRNPLVALLPRLRGFGPALTGSASDADDLMQLACERVLLRSEQLREHARLDGIMHNL